MQNSHPMRPSLYRATLAFPSLVPERGLLNQGSLSETPAAQASRPEFETKPASVRFALLALANTDDSLNQEHPINAKLRSQGAGTVPMVIATDEMEKFAIVVARSVSAQFRVPFGWHVIDNGEQVRVFEPEERVQIRMQRKSREGRDNSAIFDQIETEIRANSASLQSVRIQEGRIDVLGLRRLTRGDHALEQYHLLTPMQQKHAVLHACVTTVPARNTSALNLAELILKSLDFKSFNGGEASPGAGSRLPSPKAHRKGMVRALQAKGSVDLARNEAAEREARSDRSHDSAATFTSSGATSL